jgi:hypothetical protein
VSEFSSFSFPTLPLLGLSDDEKALISLLQRQAMLCRAEMELEQAYYLGEQVVQNLRIAIPKELEFLRTIVGWPAMAVDPYVERLRVDAFRVSSATDGDQHLMDLMDANGFAAEQLLGFTDALSMRRAYWMAGSPLEKGGAPLITVESPLNMTVQWDLRGYTPKAAWQEYWAAGRRHAAVVLPRQTLHIATDDNGQWVVADRDMHGFDFVPVVRMANRARTNDRDGRSEITPAIMSITDAACRTLLGLEVARELYSVPQRAVLGAAEDAFQKADGTQKTAWETYITKMLALERDENGDLPTIHQFQTYDPATFTKLLDWYASAMAGMVAATPQDLGLYTQGNPASAEAGAVSESRRDRRAANMQDQFGPALVRVAQMALRFENKGVLPPEYERLAVDWSPVTMQTPGVTSDAITKQIAALAVPATSDVVLKKLGYSAVERARMEQDRKREDGRQVARALAASLTPRSTGGDAATAAPAGQ